MQRDFPVSVSAIQVSLRQQQRGRGGDVADQIAPKLGATGRREARPVPKGRQVDPDALGEIGALLGARSRARDLLIEHLHLLNDAYGVLTIRHLAALAEEMRLAFGGQLVRPKRTLEAGYVFQYPDIEKALSHLVQKIF